MDPKQNSQFKKLNKDSRNNAYCTDSNACSTFDFIGYEY